LNVKAEGLASLKPLSKVYLPAGPAFLQVAGSGAINSLTAPDP